VAAAAAGRRMLPAELGLAGRRVLTLPSHVEQCDQGEQCCWRWLAHAVLKEASWLREDLDVAREEHSQYTREKQKAELDAEAYAELRGAHAATIKELKDAREEAGDLRRELASLKTAHAHKTAREQELLREFTRVEKERREVVALEASAAKRAEAAERELSKAAHTAEELQNRVLHMEDIKARLNADLQEANKERDLLRTAAEEAGKKKKKGGGKEKAKAGAKGGRR